MLLLDQRTLVIKGWADESGKIRVADPDLDPDPVGSEMFSSDPKWTNIKTNF